jgi:alpha-glucosidase
MLDFGYDIADFRSIDPIFGNIEDFQRLVELLHAREIKLILDFVPNHTSNQHSWFAESRASRQSAKRDWYVWADAGPDGGPPNNWLSRFGGSAWEWDEPTGQYYYHSFLKEQPDLNWRNPAVRSAMADVLRFWLDLGVDGFRIDASAVLAEDELLRDDPPEPKATEETPPPQRLKRIFTDDRPESLQYLTELRAVVDEYPDRVLAGEVQGKTDRIGHFYGNAKPRLHLPLNFLLLDSPWTALNLQAEIDAYLKAIPDHAWPSWVIGGHDKKRIAGKLGQAKVRTLAMLALTLRGTPFFFAGDEIGMPDVPIPKDRVQDVFEKLLPGYGLNRDPQRSPMRWDATPHAGFSQSEPWLPIGDGIADRNVALMRDDERSLLWLYRALIALRRREPALSIGDYAPLRSRNDIFTFMRRHQSDEILIALNIASEPRRLMLNRGGGVLLSTSLDRTDEEVDGETMLRADEGVIVKLGK